MSSAGWSNWDDVSLLTNRHILRTDNSAIARMSEGRAVANGTANVPSKPIRKICRDDVGGNDVEGTW